jgi:glycosyltransferase involved in cell wall biosynthesis
MASVHFLIPGDLQIRTGGYEYDRQLVEHLRARGWGVDLVGLDGSFPQPTPDALQRAEATLSSLPAGAIALIDGLALGAMPEAVEIHAARLRLVALVHHPLALETGIDRAQADRLRHSERRALARVRHVVVTSRRTAETLAEYGVTAERITVAEPGTARAPLSRGSDDGIVRLVCVASISPRKGHDVLCRALASLGTRNWRLVCVGGLRADPTATRDLQALLRTEGIADRVALVGEAGTRETAEHYHQSDAFVLATWYEGYGMAVAEALARGLPVVSTPTGAIADLVGADAGILVPAGDVDGWVTALRRVLDPAERARLAAGARRRRDELPTWEQTAVAVERALGAYV